MINFHMIGTVVTETVLRYEVKFWVLLWAFDDRAGEKAVKKEYNAKRRDIVQLFLNKKQNKII
jgi:hypothetical protein